MQKHNWDWKKLQKGRGIKVQIPNDIDKETGKQKYRPAIVIKSYPSHVKVQLMTTEPSGHDYFKIKIDNQIQRLLCNLCIFHHQLTQTALKLDIASLRNLISKKLFLIN